MCLNEAREFPLLPGVSDAQEGSGQDYSFRELLTSKSLSLMSGNNDAGMAAAPRVD